MKMGGIIANVADSVLKELDDFAIKFGLAFQIYDDVMDEISTFEEMGKTLGKDKAVQKLTYVSLYGLENSIKKCHALIQECRGIIKKYNSEVFEKILSTIANLLLIISSLYLSLLQ
jgi:geranylgeranyl pyrophosphate synthase